MKWSFQNKYSLNKEMGLMKIGEKTRESNNKMVTQYNLRRNSNNYRRVRMQGKKIVHNDFLEKPQ